MDTADKKRLRQLLLNLQGGNTQRWLADQLGVTPFSLNSWINMIAFPNRESLQIIANYMGISLEQLLEEITGEKRVLSLTADGIYLSLKQMDKEEKIKLIKLLLHDL